ncbi:MAG: hypothetical protein AAFQ98_13990 [Bacteroidota bacterium]
MGLPDLKGRIQSIGEYFLTGKTREEISALATTYSVGLTAEDLVSLETYLHHPPPSPLYQPSEHGLGTWLACCQTAIFELAFQLKDQALPFLRKHAWGTYDWPQGNAIEVMIRLAAEGIHTEELLAEIREMFPDIRFEAQVYAIKPLLPLLEGDAALQKVFDSLMEIEEFEEAYEDITYVEPDPYNLEREQFHGIVMQTEKVEEHIWNKKVIAEVLLDQLAHGSNRRNSEKVRLKIDEDCHLFHYKDGKLNEASLDEFLQAERIAIAHWTLEQANTDPQAIFPVALTRIS